MVQETVVPSGNTAIQLAVPWESTWSSLWPSWCRLFLVTRPQLDLCHMKSQKLNSWSWQMHSWVKMDAVCVTSGDSEDCEPREDGNWEPVLLLLFESDSSRQMHWIASVSCALYQRLISVWMHDVQVTNHHLLWRSCALLWKRLKFAVSSWRDSQVPSFDVGYITSALRGSTVVPPQLQGFVHYQVLQVAS